MLIASFSEKIKKHNQNRINALKKKQANRRVLESHTKMITQQKAEKATAKPHAELQKSFKKVLSSEDANKALNQFKRKADNLPEKSENEIREDREAVKKYSRAIFDLDDVRNNYDIYKKRCKTELSINGAYVLQGEELKEFNALIAVTVELKEIEDACTHEIQRRDAVRSHREFERKYKIEEERRKREERYRIEAEERENERIMNWLNVFKSGKKSDLPKGISSEKISSLDEFVKRVVELPSKLELEEIYTLNHSKSSSEVLVFDCHKGFPDLAPWNKSIEFIGDYLGGVYSVSISGIDKISLKKSVVLPDVIEYRKEYNLDGRIMFGYNCETGLSHTVNLSDMSHLLVMGISGTGKSVFLNQIMQGLLYNLKYIDALYMVDLKGGVELFPYLQYDERIEVVYRYEYLLPLVNKLVKDIHERLEYMREHGLKSWKGGLVFFIVDEYAQIQLYKPITKEQKQEHAQLLSGLNVVSMLGRAAGVRIIAQLQKGTTGVMDSSFRNNLQSQACFRVANNITAAGMFGSTEDLPIQPTNLKKGRFFFFDDSIGKTVYLQGCLIKEDHEPVIRTE